MSETVKEQRFDLVKDELVTVWCRTHYTVDATSIEEALDKAKCGNVTYEDYELLDSTMETVYKKDGTPTEEWFLDEPGHSDYKLLESNT